MNYTSNIIYYISIDSEFTVSVIFQEKSINLHLLKRIAHKNSLFRMEFVLSVIFNLDFKILSRVLQCSARYSKLLNAKNKCVIFPVKPAKSLHMTSSICKVNCTAIDGHMPYLYEVESVLTKLLINGTINSTDYPIFTEHLSDMRSDSLFEKSQQFKFFVSTTFDFESKVWKSGGFEISEERWAKRNQNEPVFPILNDRLLLVQNAWASYDHFGAVYCGDDLGEKEFKVSLPSRKNQQ